MPGRFDIPEESPSEWRYLVLGLGVMILLFAGIALTALAIRAWWPGWQS